MKICSKCKLKKDIECFYKHKNNKDGLQTYCKDCCKARKNDINYPSKKYADTFYQKNHSKILESKKQFYKNNQNKLKEYRILNKDHKREYLKLYRSNNKEKIVLSNKKYKQNNKFKINYFFKNKRINDPIFKLRTYTSVSIGMMLKLNGSSKRGNSILNHLCYSFQELKEHLEKQFEPWMTWKNWGKYSYDSWNDNDESTWQWNIDHIIPHSKFEYTSMQDQSFKDCWALSNLRPLNAKQNILKSNKV